MGLERSREAKGWEHKGKEGGREEGTSYDSHVHIRPRAACVHCVRSGSVWEATLSQEHVVRVSKLAAKGRLQPGSAASIMNKVAMEQLWKLHLVN